MKQIDGGLIPIRYGHHTPISKIRQYMTKGCSTMSHTNSSTRITLKKWQRYVTPKQDSTSNQNIMSQQHIETKPHPKKQCNYSSSGKHNNQQRTSRYAKQNVTCQMLRSVVSCKVPRSGDVYNCSEVVFVDNLVTPSQLSQIKFMTKNCTVANSIQYPVLKSCRKPRK